MANPKKKSDLNPLSDLNFAYPAKKSDSILRSSVTSPLMMESQKVEVTLVTSKYFGQYGVIQKVTAKKFKIRFWDTGEETYLWQTSVTVLQNHSTNQDRKNVRSDDTAINEKKRTKKS